MSGVEVVIEIFFPKFVKYCPRSKTKANILRTKGKKFQIMIDDASCYRYLFCYTST